MAGDELQNLSENEIYNKSTLISIVNFALSNIDVALFAQAQVRVDFNPLINMLKGSFQ